MQHDEVIWQTIRHNHCSYMAKITTGIFCRNEYNVTGICNRSSCPLANSRYATIREHDGIFYLYIKSIERAHTPNKLWEKIKLPRNYEKALEIIDNNMLYWPKFLVHKIKQRLTKMTQMRIRMRKIQLKVREKIMTVPTKERKREARREEKAEKAAVLHKSIEKELLERLKKGIYGDVYNFNEDVFKSILDAEELDVPAEEEEPEVEYVEGDFEEEEDMEDFVDFMKDETLVGDGEDSDLEDMHMQLSGKKRKGSDSGSVKGAFDALHSKLKGKGKVLVEVENDDDTVKEKLRH